MAIEQVSEPRKRRNRGPSAEKIALMIKAAAEAGHPVSEIRHEPDGVVRLLLQPLAREETPASPLNEWKCKREKRKSLPGTV